VERLKIENEARATAAKNEADRLKFENDARLATAGAEADRLKRENEAQSAAQPPRWAPNRKPNLSRKGNCCRTLRQFNAASRPAIQRAV
jgi:hypothetical protein